MLVVAITAVMVRGVPKNAPGLNLTGVRTSESRRIGGIMSFVSLIVYF
jgi:hypothetical protein